MLPRSIRMTLTYRSIDDLLKLIDAPYREQCEQLLRVYRDLFETAQGSTHNHQTWPGGYIDHVTDGMNLMVHFYALLTGTGRPLSFSRSDALLIFFLHDLEKPWRIQVDAKGQVSNRAGIETKEQFKSFREEKLREFGIVLDPRLMNALTYIEGEYKDYTSKRRVMNELAAFCHMVDTWCARGWHDYPQYNDEWIGAGRFREDS